MKKTRLEYYVLILLFAFFGKAFAQQGFGTTLPNSASVIEMASPSKGVLIPRVALTNINVFEPVKGLAPFETHTANSLLVYNTNNTAGESGVSPGFYYWLQPTAEDDGVWTRLGPDNNNVNIDANNGLSVDGDYIQLGGSLVEDTEIDLDGNALAFKGLPSGTTTDNMVVADPVTGRLKQRKAPPMFFYMPPVIFDTQTNGNNLERDLYQDYVNQFTGNPYNIAHGVGGYSMPYTGGLIKSLGAPNIPVYGQDELWFYVMYFDTTVFAGPDGTGVPQITADGKLQYSIIGTASETSFMTIAFSIKDEED